LDTDLASAFAKVNAITLLVELLHEGYEIYITPRIYEELQVPLSYGYDFPKIIFEHVPVLNLKKGEQEEYRSLIREFPRVGRGELEAIAVCKHRRGIFASLDRKALDIAKANGVPVLVLGAILLEFLKRGLYSKEELEVLIREINEKDNRDIRMEDLRLES